jgi:hypothetical protein
MSAVSSGPVFARFHNSSSHREFKSVITISLKDILRTVSDTPLQTLLSPIILSYWRDSSVVTMTSAGAVPALLHILCVVQQTGCKENLPEMENSLLKGTAPVK